MMIFDRQKQRLLLEGKEYTPGDIHSLVAEGEGNLRGEKRCVSKFSRSENI